MLDQDIPVWYRFLDFHGIYFDALYYDCFVGGPWYSKEKLKDPYFFMWRALNAKRIDAIAETEKFVWIIEVNSNPGLRAIGQLIIYERLWLEDPKIDKPVVKVLVCAIVQPDLLSAAASVNIVSYVMPGSNRQTLPI